MVKIVTGYYYNSLLFCLSSPPLHESKFQFKGIIDWPQNFTHKIFTNLLIGFEPLGLSPYLEHWRRSSAKNWRNQRKIEHLDKNLEKKRDFIHKRLMWWFFLTADGHFVEGNAHGPSELRKRRKGNRCWSTRKTKPLKVSPFSWSKYEAGSCAWTHSLNRARISGPGPFCACASLSSCCGSKSCNDRFPSFSTPSPVQ